MVRRHEANSDEVNSIAIHARGTYLAAGDDSGVVQACRLPWLFAKQALPSKGVSWLSMLTSHVRHDTFQDNTVVHQRLRQQTMQRVALKSKSDC